MANYCVSPYDSFYTECKIVPAADYNMDANGFLIPGATYTESYSSDTLRIENNCPPTFSNDLCGKLNESERLRNSTTKHLTNYVQTAQHSYKQVTRAFHIFEDSSTITSPNCNLLNRSRCPLTPVNHKYDNLQICQMTDCNKIIPKTRLNSNDNASKAVHINRHTEYDCQREGLSMIEHTLPAINNSQRVANINLNPTLGSTVPDTDRLQTSSADTTILKGKKMRRHIPHYLRPQDFVERRNSRERKRIGNVNDAFEVLRRHIPSLKDKEGASKINILRFAIEYIHDLGSLL